ncbi:AB hydrolase superfamily yvaM [Fusarium heterosporum]|uniref:AB hydrolase superfamily yvaM n=1 Tax=Fusarium heterosporum TaxID=42747 RepID=A0A8H5SUB4_FUSHE|nr:AB hydrolase superfamily yvaM [Fusarium heterosporum]
MSVIQNQDEKMLYFEERNKDQNESLIFLHGGGGSHVEWKLVAAQQSLASYHLILVDLPMHSGSWDIAPCSLEKAAEEVSKVIRLHAHQGKAHIVGFSLGAFVALVLTSRNPDSVLSTFATGGYPYKGLYKWVMQRPTVMSILNSIQNIPGLTEMSLQKQGIDYEEWMAECKKNKSPERSRDMARELSDFGLEHVKAVADSGVRTCVISGGKMDQTDAVQEMGVMLQEGGQKKGVDNKAFVVRNAYHPWHLQLPELFASGVDAWVRGQELPVEFESLL